MGSKGKGKRQHSKAKAGAAGKKQKTCASAEPVEEGGAIVPADAAMGAMQFHRGVAKMKNLLKYRASEKCLKAYIYRFRHAAF